MGSFQPPQFRTSTDHREGRTSSAAIDKACSSLLRGCDISRMTLVAWWHSPDILDSSNPAHSGILWLNSLSHRRRVVSSAPDGAQHPFDLPRHIVLERKWKRG
ncbi:MAG: hypothetical protein HY673_04720 [Chloroflexi bacterium]|nr:hypothetical protein [Chloroflexota bacterium]